MKEKFHLNIRKPFLTARAVVHRSALPREVEETPSSEIPKMAPSDLPAPAGTGLSEPGARPLGRHSTAMGCPGLAAASPRLLRAALQGTLCFSVGGEKIGKSEPG